MIRRSFLPTARAAASVAIVALVAACSISPGATHSSSPVVSSLPAVTAPPSQAAGGANCPKAAPQPMAGGEKKVVTIDTAKGPIEVTVEADLGPLAAENFVDLAACGFYDGTVFHRTPTLQDGTPFVIQGGDPDGNGTGGPGYTIQDEPVTTPYKRGTVAMARSTAPNSVGSQFFIVLDDKDGAILGDANTYQIIGNVTSGMETADSIYLASGGEELPADPVPITTATVATP